MGIFYHTLEISGPASNGFQRVVAVVDTGSTFTQVPSALLRRLGVEPTEMVRFRLANGSIIRHPVGEARVRVGGRTLTTFVVFGDNDAASVLGAYTLEGALLAVDPVGQRLVPTDALMM